MRRETEDLAAVIDAVGGRAHLFGASSGGALALEAAAAGLPIDRIAVHEVPYLVDGAMVSAWRVYLVELTAALDAGDRDEALRLFMRLAGSSDEGIAAAEHLPHARRATITVPGHVADPATLGPVLTAFYTG